MKEHIKKDYNRYKNPENSELKPNLSSNLLSEWRSRSIRSGINMSKFQDCERNSSPMILADLIKWHTLKHSSPFDYTY